MEVLISKFSLLLIPEATKWGKPQTRKRGTASDRQWRPCRRGCCRRWWGRRRGQPKCWARPPKSCVNIELKFSYDMRSFYKWLHTILWQVRLLSYSFTKRAFFQVLMNKLFLRFTISLKKIPSCYSTNSNFSTASKSHSRGFNMLKNYQFCLIFRKSLN